MAAKPIPKRHHFLPEWLQKGFAASGTTDKVTVYTKSRSYPACIKDTGVERYFHSRRREPDLEIQISNFEQQFQDFVRQIRDLNLFDPRSPVNPILFAHIETRTKATRNRTSNVGRGIVEKLTADTVLHSQVRKFNYPLTNQNRKWLLSETRRQVERKFSKVAIDEVAKEAHISVLERIPAPQHKIAQYEKCRFKLVTLSEQSMILGDSPVFFRTSEKDLYSPYVTDQFRAAYLPLSPSLILVAENGPPLPIEAAALRYGAAVCSHNFFIASRREPSLEKLIAEIGRAEALVTQMLLGSV